MDADQTKLLRLTSYWVLFITWFFIGAINLATYLNPPKKINPNVGYRTQTSMQNQANWDYANKVSSEVMLYSINFYLISSLLLIYFLRSRPSPILPLSIVLFNLMLCIGVGIAISEKKLARFEQRNATD